MKEHPGAAWTGSFGDRTGIVYREMTAGRAVATLAVEKHHCNPPGVCHGGVVFTLADDCMGAAVVGLAPDGHVPTSAQLNIHFMRSVRPGAELTATAEVVSPGKRIAVIEATVTDEEGRQTALLTATYLFVPRRPVATSG